MQTQKAAFRRGTEPLICLLWKPQQSDTVAYTWMSKAAHSERRGCSCPGMALTVTTLYEQGAPAWVHGGGIRTTLGVTGTS